MSSLLSFCHFFKTEVQKVNNNFLQDSVCIQHHLSPSIPADYWTVLVLRSTLPLASRAHSWQALRMALGSSREEQKEDGLPQYSCHVLRIKGKDRPPCMWRAEEEENGRTRKESVRTRTGQKARILLCIHLQMLPNIPLQFQLGYSSCLIPPVPQARRPGGSVPALAGVLLVQMEESCAILLRSPTLPGTYLKGIGLTRWNEALSPTSDAFSKFLHFNKVTLKSGNWEGKKKNHFQCLKWKMGTTCNAKNKKIEYINFLCYRINRCFFTKPLHHSAHKMEGAPQ